MRLTGPYVLVKIDQSCSPPQDAAESDADYSKRHNSWARSAADAMARQIGRQIPDAILSTPMLAYVCNVCDRQQWSPPPARPRRECTQEATT